MVELRPLIDFLLRQAGYRTEISKYSWASVLAFENESIIGFAFVFDKVTDLLAHWQAYEFNILRAKSKELVMAANKSWNVYCVFLTDADASEDEARQVLRIEENLERTRKIARAVINSEVAAREALLSLFPLQSHPKLSGSDYRDVLKERINVEFGSGISDALFGVANPDDVAQMLLDRP